MFMVALRRLILQAVDCGNRPHHRILERGAVGRVRLAAAAGIVEVVGRAGIDHDIDLAAGRDLAAGQR